MMFFSCNVLNVNECVSMNNQECKIRPKVINVNSDKPAFYPYSVQMNKFRGSCNNIDDPFAKLCIPDVLKNINLKIFDLMSRINKTESHETCKCKCRLDASVCNNEQRLNNDKSRCEYKELIVRGICDKGFIWNPGNCNCECDKSCDVEEYLDYKNFKCRERSIDELVEKYGENIDEKEIYRNETICHACKSYTNHQICKFLTSHQMCKSCSIYMVLFSMFLTTSIGIGAVFVLVHKE